jgi:hypothetical protein
MRQKISSTLKSQPNLNTSICWRFRAVVTGSITSDNGTVPTITDSKWPPALIGTMSLDRICPQTATMQEGMFVKYGSLSNFESVVVHYVFVYFHDFFLSCHVMIKILVGMFERRMSASDRSQRFSDDRRGGRDQIISQISEDR